MNERDRDQAWYDGLTGKADDGSRDAREGTALRKVVQAEDKLAAGKAADKLDELMNRLEQEDLIEPEFKPRKQNRWYAIAASFALAAITVPMIMQLTQPPPDLIEIPRGAAEPVEIAVANPESVSHELAVGLVKLGGVVEHYEYDGRWIVDAQVAALPQGRLRKLLKKYNIAVPEGGRILLAFSKETDNAQ